MAACRALCILIALLGFFLIGTPLQWVIARRAPWVAHRIPTLFCRSLLWLLRVGWSVEGARVTDRPVLMVANHVSWIDILVLGSVTPFCFLAKREVATWPLLSAFAEVQGTVFVDRARRRSIPAANRQMAERMQAGRAVLLFPEGTTVDAREPGPFRSSHFAAARDFLQNRTSGSEVADSVTIQPIAIGYSSANAAWVGDDDLISHLWRVLRAPPLRCTLTFAPPIPYAPEADRKVIAVEARAAIVATLRRRRPAQDAIAPLTTAELLSTTSTL